MAARKEKLEAGEVAYQAFLVTQMQAAVNARDSWAQHVTAKYRLGPGDTVDEDGTVVRRPTPQPPS